MKPSLVPVQDHFPSLHPKTEALPGVLGNRGIRPFTSGEQGNKSKNERNWETKAILGNREHIKSRFGFWGTKKYDETGTAPANPLPLVGPLETVDSLVLLVL